MGVLAGLTTRGRCLLAAGLAAALCALLLDERDLLRIAVFVVALPIIAAVMAANARIGLAALRHLVPERVPVGTSSEVRLEVRSSGRLPAGGLMLEDGVPYALGNKPRFVVERLPRRSAAVLRYPLQPVMRGVHQLGPLRARVTDPFGLAEFERELGGRSRLVVVPKVLALTGLPHGSGMGAGDDGAVRLRAGQGEDDAIIRQYRHGDDLRKVHWKSTARRDELMVRVEESPWHGGVSVLLDTRAAAHRGNGPTSSLEWAISLAASICLHLHKHGQHVRLTTEEGVLLAGGSASAGLSDVPVLDALAALHPAHRAQLAVTGDPGAGREMIAVLGDVNPASVAELVRFRPRGVRSLAVLLDVNSWASAREERGADPADAVRLLTSAGWGAVVARPEQGMASVWTLLCNTVPEKMSSGHIAGAGPW